ncbi:uncharacterized protein LOC116340526 [Contarinia nasturtii]|uniref:uncharacterized protein LOC116340526 n=1 Tax=Contarinia nasturtii TaxID=265458 RepID=UPI0012D3F982|nr:uncharacterized protein LOC116340526 [Contarinia nasturtii]
MVSSSSSEEEEASLEEEDEEKEVEEEDEEETYNVFAKRIHLNEVQYLVVNDIRDSVWVRREEVKSEIALHEFEVDTLQNIDEVEWDPLPKRIINAITIDGVIEYLVQFADGTQTMVSFTCGPMRQLIEQFEKDRIYRSVVQLNRLSELDIQNIRPASTSVNTRPKRKSAIATSAAITTITRPNVENDANYQPVVRLSRLSDSDIPNAHVIRPPPSTSVFQFSEQNEPSTSRGPTSAPKRTYRSRR